MARMIRPTKHLISKKSWNNIQELFGYNKEEMHRAGYYLQEQFTPEDFTNFRKERNGCPEKLPRL